MGALMKSMCHFKKKEVLEKENDDILTSINNFAYRNNYLRLY